MYSVGEGRDYQLGLLSPMQCGERDPQTGHIAPTVAPGPPQRVPQRVLPSGTLRFGADAHIAQVAAGTGFAHYTHLV